MVTFFVAEQELPVLCWSVALTLTLYCAFLWLLILYLLFLSAAILLSTCLGALSGTVGAVAAGHAISYAIPTKTKWGGGGNGVPYLFDTCNWGTLGTMSIHSTICANLAIHLADEDNGMLLKASKSKGSKNSF